MLWLLALLFVQTPSPWIGTLEFRDSGGLSVARVSADLAITKTSVSGHWYSKSGASGAITGTIDQKGHIAATFTISGGAQLGNGSAVPERCHGETKAAGQLHSGGEVIRLASDRIRLDTPTQRARERQCEDVSRVVLLLQPVSH